MTKQPLVPVYFDPLTETEFEGHAVVVRVRKAIADLVSCDVRFFREAGVYRRCILAKRVGGVR